MAHVGTATSRVDGRAKVTGTAKYAADFNAAGLAYASVVTSAIARGRIVQIDTGEASRVEGVIAILTHGNRGHMADSDTAYKDDVAPDGSPFRPLYDDKIRFNDQPIALVVAERWETARFAASLVRVSYQQEPHATSIHSERKNATAVAEPGEDMFAPPKPRGDAEHAFAAAQVRHEGEYYVPIEHHNPMEPFASTVIWEGDGRLTVYDKTQGVLNVHRYLCRVFGMAPHDLRVMSQFVGGAFGSGLRPQYQVALAVLAARTLRRSVRLVLSRRQNYGLGHRPAMIQKIRLGATGGGTLDAITHEAITTTSPYENFYRQETGWSGLLYACANTKYAHRLAKLDLATSCDMRAPSAVTGLFALESAMDELAVELKVDPIELRLRCYSERDQNAGRPYSSKRLRACYREGAQAFGWSRRRPEPRSMRDGTELVGWGMATGIWDAMRMPITVRIEVAVNGHAEVSTAASDIGTGTRTIMAQVAADSLGLALDSITVHLGDSSLPRSPVEGGSWLAASVANGIATTAAAVRSRLLRMTRGMRDSPFADAAPGDVTLACGKLLDKRDGSRWVSISDIMRHGGVDRIEEEISTPVASDPSHSHNTHSAVFAEVRVDEELGVARVVRVLSAVAAGRILNPKTAGSQIMGGIVWGIGMALHEQTLLDHHFGRIMNPDIAEYLLPVNADVPDVTVIFVDEPDDVINPLGIKGVGEIGIVGVAPAIANAIHHATGKRVRDLPITIDKLL